MGHFDLGPRMSHLVSQLLAKRDMEVILMVFLKEILLYSEQFGHFGTKMVWFPLHFESALRFFY